MAIWRVNGVQRCLQVHACLAPSTPSGRPLVVSAINSSLAYNSSSDSSTRHVGTEEWMRSALQRWRELGGGSKGRAEYSIHDMTGERYASDAGSLVG